MTKLSEAYVDFIAGWVSGAVSVMVCQPVDTVLTRLQAGVSTTAAMTTTTSTASAAATSSAATISLQASTRSYMQQYGLSALWRGSSSMIGAVPFQNALLMGGYGLGKKWSESSSASSSTAESTTTSTTTATSNLLPIFVGGCTGGILQSFLMSPAEYVKVQQQVVHPNFAPAATVRYLLQTSSMSSMAVATRGLNATLLRDGIPHGVWFVAYEWCKNIMTAKVAPDATSLEDVPSTISASTTPTTSTTYETLVVPITSGAFAATVAWAVGYPFDIIKTRIQTRTNNNNNNISNNPQQSRGIYATAVELVHESNGNIIRGLYRGFGLKLIRAVPASMIGFTTYEFVSNRLSI